MTPPTPLRSFSRPDEAQTPLSSRRLSFRKILPQVAILVGLLAYYLALFLRYRPYDIDNCWFLSFSYDTFVEHVDSDQFMNVHFPAGMDGTQLFGKLAAATQYLFLAHAGWQQAPAALLSASFVTLALACWGMQFRKLGSGPNFILCFLIVAGISEPFLSVASKYRYEFLSFFLLSLALLLVAYRKPTLGLFLAATTVEIQPVAVAGIIPVLVLALSLEKVNLRLIARLTAGLALAAPVYLALHPHAISLWEHLARSPAAPIGLDGGYFVAYFVKRPRHLPELLCFLVAGIQYWRKRRSFNSHYLAISALLLTLFSLAMPHGNASYMIFSYPFLIGMALAAFNAERRPWLIVAAMLLFTLPQDLYLIHLTRGMSLRSNDVATVAQAVEAAAHTLAIPDSSLRIFGDYRLWYAHPHLYRAASPTTLDHIQQADLYLCLNSSRQPQALDPPAMLDCSDLQSLLPLRLLNTVWIRNNQVLLYAKQ